MKIPQVKELFQIFLKHGLKEEEWHKTEEFRFALKELHTFAGIQLDDWH